MSTRRAILFEYKWWRIKEGLTYKEIDHLPYLHGLNMKQGSYLLCDGAWFYRGQRVVKREKPTLITMAVFATEVPKELRAIALLLQ